MRLRTATAAVLLAAVSSPCPPAAIQRNPSNRVFAAALDAITALARDPRPPGVKKLAGSRDDWRVRIGEYRTVNEVDDRLPTVTVMRVAHRRESYR